MQLILSKINEELNKIPYFSNKKCFLCGRECPDTILNIEGMIHHRRKVKCLDVKACNRFCRKLNNGKQAP